MGPPLKDVMAGLGGIIFLFFLLSLFQSAVLGNHSAIDAHVKRQPAAPLPFRRAGTTASVSPFANRAAVGISTEDSLARLPDVASTKASSPASSSAECFSDGCENNPKKKPLIKFRPSLMIRGAIPLTDDTYFDFMKANPIVLVLFYAPWCSWSRRTLPEFESAARVLAQEQSGEDAVLLAKIDCTQNEEVMFHEEIDEFPTIKLFVHERPKVYDGGRQRADILRWVQLHLNQGRTVGSVDSLKEIFACRALGTLVVIAAWRLDPKTAADKSEELSSTSTPNVDDIKNAGGLLTKPTAASLSQEHIALRSVSSPDARKRTSNETSSLPGSADTLPISTDAAAAVTEETSTSRHLPVHASEHLKHATASQSSSHSQTDETAQREAFLHVARLAGSNVIFGEASTSEVVKFLMDKYIEPHLHGKVRARMQLPLVAAFPAKTRGPLSEAQSLLPNEEIRLYHGKLEDWKHMDEFVRASKFPPVVPFTNFWAPKIFDDGRPVCVLFIDSYSTAEATNEKRSPTFLQKEAFLKVAPEFRAQFLFTVAGYSKPHEKRLVTLLGLEDNATSTQLRIVTFNPQRNNNYYPVLKYRPTPGRKGPYSPGEGKMEGQRMPIDQSRGATGGLRPATAAQDMRKEAKEDDREHVIAEEGDDHDRAVYRFEQELRTFLISYLKGSLEPYLRSEPVPSAEENQSGLKIVVGSTFDQLVRLSEEDVLVEFGAPWCGHCRKLEPTLKLLAAALHEANSRVVLAKMDATRNEVKGLYFVAYPTLVLFPSMVKESPLIYEGDRTEEKLLEWLSRNVRGSRINVEHVRRIMNEKKKHTTIPERAFQQLQMNDMLHEPDGAPLHHSVLEEL